jgi:hypothetical protein
MSLLLQYSLVQSHNTGKNSIINMNLYFIAFTTCFGSLLGHHQVHRAQLHWPIITVLLYIVDYKSLIYLAPRWAPKMYSVTAPRLYVVDNYIFHWN